MVFTRNRSFKCATPNAFPASNEPAAPVLWIRYSVAHLHQRTLRCGDHLYLGGTTLESRMVNCLLPKVFFCMVFLGNTAVGRVVFWNGLPASSFGVFYSSFGIVMFHSTGRNKCWILWRLTHIIESHVDLIWVGVLWKCIFLLLKEVTPFNMKNGATSNTLSVDTSLK